MGPRRFRGLPRTEVVGCEALVAIRFGARLLGLAGLAPGDIPTALLIPRCGSIHTFGMRFPLTVVFLDRQQRPLAVRRHVRPRQLLRCRGATAVLEIPEMPDSTIALDAEGP